MSEHVEIVTNEEEIAIEEGEPIIEEVIDSMNEPIEVEQVEWMGTTEVLEEHGAAEEYYSPDDILEQSIVDFDDREPYQSYLPIRHGIPVLSLNLPDLMSKVSNFSGTEKLIQCFNKKCQRQISFSGFLYTIKNYVSEAQWNNWLCVNPHCFGEVRTTPDMLELRVVNPHSNDCMPDELQIRIRVAVYDLRLMAEFTDIPLEAIYGALENRIKTEFPDAIDIFPPFEALKATLDDHRINKIYRKRFEMQNLRDKQKKLNMTPDEVVYTENASGLIKFRRTKPFPPSICIECNDQLISDHLPSQDNLIAHYMYTHGKRMTIERFEFKDLNMFDQYLRELNLVSRHKMRRMGLADENMYFLCQHDDRLSKSGVGRASRLQQQNCHCTAFIRIFDWRIVSKREASKIVVDYCLEHQIHDQDNSILSSREEIDYYTPEVFARDMDERRIRNQKIMESEGARVKRPLELKSFIPSGRARPQYGARALAPPLSAQMAAGNRQPFVDMFDERFQTKSRSRAKFSQSIRTACPKPENEQTSAQAVEASRIFMQHKAISRTTERQNFRDIYAFNAVCKLEDASQALLARMQNCQSARVALAYREKINEILKHANNDPALSETASQEDCDNSWVLAKYRGRGKKRGRVEEEEEEEEEEEREDGEDVEEEERDDAVGSATPMDTELDPVEKKIAIEMKADTIS
uniref:Uncharacterized protein n=1 Tax=Caenorhabditis japonica TaxID=281687 RepID=A0A8R1I276_CAEJA